MAKIIEETNVQYYKYMKLAGEALTVQIQEKSKHQESSITIYHSPAKFDIPHEGLKFTSKQALRDYIDMLEQFYEKYADELEIVKGKK